MGKREYGQYFLGLDIGTESVGWAVTDDSYKLQKFGSKTMWGVRLFQEAQTAEPRRLYRVARRRIERRVQRIALLQELFAQAVQARDPGFFMRLQEGALHEEDKSLPQRNSLFFEPGFQDKDYHKQYPTIYHLRNALIASDQPVDVRLVYLAVHHIIKNRGHFLFGGQLDEVPVLEDILADMAEEGFGAFGIVWDTDQLPQVKRVLTDRSLRMSDKQKQLMVLLSAKDSRAKAFVKAMTGGTVNLHDLFDLSAQLQSEKIKVEFASDDYDTKVPELEDILGEDYYYLDKLKAIHDWAVLEGVTGGGGSLSAAKVALYEEHGEDLKALKRVVKRYDPEAYKEVFHSAAHPHNYAAYVGMTKKNGKKLVIEKRCNHVDFIKYISGILKKMDQNDPEVQRVVARAEAGQLLPKAVSKANGVIPNQLHYIELRAILKNASAYLPFLREKDEEGLSVSDKIMQILTFKIPYYVGPLNNRDPHAKNTWVVRHTQEKIYPWNFNQVVNVQASASEFITRMTSDCTYLSGEKVLPKHSLLYSQFMVLNELNNLKIDGQAMPDGLKKELYAELFLKRSKVTAKAVLDYLASKGYKLQADALSGIDGDFKASMKPMLDMKKLLGTHYRDDIAEAIIYLSTIFGEDRAMLRARIEADFAGVLPKELIQRASTKRYTGWGRLSAAFLNGIQAADPHTGELQTIVQMMWHTDNNLMQLLSSQFGFAQEVQKHHERKGEHKGPSYAMVDQLYVSPSVKRAIWQTLQIVDEIKKVTSHAPAKLFIEVARGEEKKERKESRKHRLLELYKSCGEEARALAASLEAREEGDLRRDRLYLYYTQLGRCMYTGDEITLSKLFDETVYDVDHIYPQSKVKDDSLDNRVLVKRELNAEKRDVYPLDSGIRNKQKAFWKMLLDKELIGRKKYDRLVRATPLENDELLAFIARQLVETRQSTKAVAGLLKQLLPETKVEYVKAGLVSDFRKKFDMLKCREVNDLHHAVDAYLNIVVGNAYHTKFTDDPRNFFGESKPEYNLKRFYEFDIVRGGIYAWRRGEGGTIGQVKKTVRLSNPLITRMAYEQHGQLFDVQLVKKGQWQLPHSSKRDCFLDTSKYGGYNKIKSSYFMLVEHDDKRNKRCRSLIDMPIRIKGLPATDPAVQEMLRDVKGLKNPVVIVPKVRMNSFIVLDGFPMNLKGRTGDYLSCSHGVQLILGYSWETYCRDILKFTQRNAEYSKMHKGLRLQVGPKDGITQEKNIELYDELIKKMQSSIYQKMFKSTAEALTKARDAFVYSSLGEQCEVIKQLLKVFACNSAIADLSSIGLSKNVGLVRPSNMISRCKSAMLLHQSITGLFEHAQDLLK